MKLLVIGSGGREHALAWKLAQSSLVEKIYIAPGNGGTALEAKCENINIKSEDLQALLAFAKDNAVALTVVGPEIPLAMGIVDLFQKEGLKIFGPNGDAAQMEASKAFAKDVMTAANVPTAKYKEFSDADEAKRYITEQGAPIVVKADGLAAGKGVTVAQSVEEALNAVEDALVGKIFGEGNAKVVIEQFLTGQEVSYLVLTDGENVIPLASAQDHKAVFDGDKGANTGGMGAYSPAPVLADDQYAKVTDIVIKPVLRELKRRGIIYRGILYAGLMVSEKGEVNVIEFNCRFGDPETQVLLPKMASDLLEHLMAAADGDLSKEDVCWHKGSVATVVLASGGYPGDYKKGIEIKGIADGERVEDVKIFHAGTAVKDGKLVTAGGRVLNVTATGDSLRDALAKVYKAIESISFEGMHFRKDIGHRALK